MQHQMFHGFEYQEYFEAIIGQVTKLKRMSDGFMRFVEFEKPNLKPTDLNKEIEINNNIEENLKCEKDNLGSFLKKLALILNV